MYFMYMYTVTISETTNLLIITNKDHPSYVYDPIDILERQPYERICVDKDECLNGEHNCHENGICTNSAGSFSCRCVAGYEGDGVSCDNVNECIDNDYPNQCDLNSTICEDNLGSYTCPCRGTRTLFCFLYNISIR